MPGLKLYTSNRLEALAGELSEILRQPLASPTVPEIILVQSRGMERWLSLEMARRLGICANIRFPFPNHFVEELFQCRPARSGRLPGLRRGRAHLADHGPAARLPGRGRLRAPEGIPRR